MALTSFHYTKTLLFPDDLYKQNLKKSISERPIDEKALSYGIKYQTQLALGYEVPAETIWINDTICYGLYSKIDLNPGDFIGEYTGLISEHTSYYKLNDYLFSYPSIDGYSKMLSIDAEAFGNNTRFINHSFTPNLSQFYAFHNGLYHLILIANQKIKKNSQLHYSYGHSYWYLRGPPCSI